MQETQTDLRAPPELACKDCFVCDDRAAGSGVFLSGLTHRFGVRRKIEPPNLLTERPSFEIYLPLVACKLW